MARRRRRKKGIHELTNDELRFRIKLFRFLMWSSVLVIIGWQVLFWCWVGFYEFPKDYDFTGAGMGYFMFTILSFAPFGHCSDKMFEYENRLESNIEWENF